MHTYHPDVHAVGLVDGCPACAEIAENPPGNCDEGLLRQIVAAAVAVPREIPPGETQAIAVANVLNTLERVGRIAEAAPDLLERYLRERWHLRVRIQGRD